jgi:thymidylate kinase
MSDGGPSLGDEFHYTPSTGTRGERSTGATSGDPMEPRSPASPTDRSRAPWHGPTIALIGQDGAGKSTIARRVIEHLPYDAETVYMGINLEASTVMLPTTRLSLALKRHRGRRPDMTAHADMGVRRKGVLADLRRLIRVTNWIAEELYRSVLVRRIRRRGAIAILDRDFYCDYYWSAVAPTQRRPPLDVRIHGTFLRRWYPKPDLVLLLDAPLEVLQVRRPEDDPQHAAERRASYLALADILPTAQVVAADRPLPEVVDDITRRIVDFVSADASSTTIPSVEGLSA